MRTLSLFIGFSLLGAGCAGSLPPQQYRPAIVSASGDPNEVLGIVNGMEIKRSHLGPGLEQELKAIDNEALQRRFHVLWAAVDSAITNAVLAQEAQRQGKTPTELRAQELETQAAAPTDEEIRKIYDDNKDIISVPFEEAAPFLNKQLAAERFAVAERALVGNLRDKADIRYAIKAPTLPRFPVEGGGSPSFGEKDAPVTVVEFSDFECPYCGRASRQLKQLAELYPKSVRIVFRDFPLSQHKNARAAAEAARCANEQERFWEYHDRLFENPKALGPEELREYAEKLGLNMEQFQECLRSDRPKKEVQANLEAGRRFGVEGTPAVFVNGIKLIGLLPIPMMRAIIDKELGNS